ncbi:hypothetical protein COT48_03525 [Candidatus Woesearchaeota archaeon CG08_land_8_20_14_0_20_47_9]|nr:MAG: hypothetical protein AUJ69_02815 [Candidatus Woesearchaeota archaeon CG1_02_47_18]PIO03783.1 MAG: hypothetical protein COT48_03525 [Candidatus Woesearchaeota archaeon CG08_land_8_20_14_0_20_47_9]HII30143.1 hypothetical protein [Candidatus Woesearchaeota archaeon]
MGLIRSIPRILLWLGVLYIPFAAGRCYGRIEYERELEKEKQKDKQELDKQELQEVNRSLSLDSYLLERPANSIETKLSIHA